MQDIIILDGGMGTELQARGLRPGERPELFGLEHPHVIEEVHSNYIEAGSRVIYSNTFGANRHKLEGTGYTVHEVITANVATAKKVAGKTKEVRVALDVGPIGELLEPLGALRFEEAYDIYKEMVLAGQSAGADIIVFETLTDLYEVKAAVLAAKENSDLPIWVTMTFEENGRTFIGASVESVAVTLEALGVSAIGVNCSLGPKELVPIVDKLMEWTALPIIVKPNAGLPNPKTGAYEMSPAEFAKEMSTFLGKGVAIMGGCCGTNPSFIREISQLISGDSKVAVRVDRLKKKGVASPGTVAEYGKINVIGERINPTGKKRLQQALQEEDMSYIMKLAIEQQEAGATVLDINVGAQGVDEIRLMPKVIKAVQSVVDLPIQIDSANPEVIEAGLRVVNGRAIVNSVNGEKNRLEAILPLVKHYGAAVLGLAMDERGLPETAGDRITIANKIVAEAENYGIEREDVIIDCLALTVSAQQEQAMETLRAIRTVKEEMGLHTALGVSNISFGLPARSHMTEVFLIQAMHAGLDFPIVNPNAKEIMDAIVTFRAVIGEDKDCAGYIERFAPEAAEMKRRKELGLTDGENTIISSATTVGDNDMDALMNAVIKGLNADAKEITRQLLLTEKPMDIIKGKIIPALDIVGERYEKEIIFLPQLINAAGAATAGLELIKNKLAEQGDGSIAKEKIILATVEGDIHDIGKNIVKVVLENYGYQIIDLGRDVPIKTVVDTAVEQQVRLVGLSALMTTTVPAMKDTIEALKLAGHECHTVVGGAVLTADYASEIGADFYAGDAQGAVEIARKILG